jgi:hypothetical protein
MYDVTNVIAGQNSIVYFKEYAETNELPDPAAYGTAWTGYEDVGATSGGTELSIETRTTDHFIDQSLDPVLTLFTSRNTELRTTLAETTPDNYIRATGQGEIDTEAAGASTYGHTTWTLTDELSFNYGTWGFEAQNPHDNQAIQWIAFRGFPVGNVSSRMGTASDYAKIPVVVKAQPGHPDGILIVRDVEAPTGA